MQTTLLGFAIVIILALVTALVGPFFVDWDSYRDDFEARASALTGLEFKVAGAIDARLLPTPTLVLHDIQFGRAGESGRVRGKTLSLEFALGSLLRGELKVADARLEGPELAIGLDRSGHLALPVPSVRFAPDAVSIQRLSITDGRAILTDAASGSRLVLDKLEFNGDLRSLAGPAKGDGSFVVAGQHYPYRFSAGRVGDDGSVKVRLNVDPIDRPLTAEADLSISIEQGVPHFDGNLAFARPVGRAPEGAQTLIIEPWRIVSHIKGDSSAAVLDQIELQYGPDERPIKLRGDAKLTLADKLQLDGALSSAQVDLDRILALPEATRHRPMVAVKAVAEYFSGALRLPFPVRARNRRRDADVCRRSASAGARRVQDRRRDLGHRGSRSSRAGAHAGSPERALRGHSRGHCLQGTRQDRLQRSARTARMAERSLRSADGGGGFLAHQRRSVTEQRGGRD